MPDSPEGDALLALVTYNQGAQALIERLEAYERCIEAIRGHIIPHNS